MEGIGRLQDDRRQQEVEEQVRGELGEDLAMLILDTDLYAKADGMLPDLALRVEDAVIQVVEESAEDCPEDDEEAGLRQPVGEEGQAMEEQPNHVRLVDGKATWRPQTGG